MWHLLYPHIDKFKLNSTDITGLWSWKVSGSSYPKEAKKGFHIKESLQKDVLNASATWNNPFDGHGAIGLNDNP